MNLENTVELMISEDYRDRFIAEYWQMQIRHDKLKELIQKIEISEDYYDGDFLEFEINCPLELLKDQLSIMEDYLDILDKRRIIEGIEF